MNKEKVTVQTTIKGDLQKIWLYWTQPSHITKWNFASDDWCCPKSENDLRVGGKMSSRMEDKDGSFGFDFEGVYNEIIDHEKITYTMPDGRVSTTTFESLVEHAEVTTVFDADAQNSIAMQRDGWQAILNNFKSYVESH